MQGDFFSSFWIIVCFFTLSREEKAENENGVDFCRGKREKLKLKNNVGDKIEREREMETFNADIVNWQTENL